jgi:drug/metabolite transporter (DMT)-like permease
MHLPWWAWSLISVAGFTAMSLISIRFVKGGLSAELVNAYVFTVGAVVFLAYGLASGADLNLPKEYRWWLVPMGIALFIANYAMVVAFGAAPNGGYVKAIGALEMVLVATIVAIVAAYQKQPVELPWWKVVGITFCLLGAMMVSYDKPAAAPERVPEPIGAAASVSPGSSSPSGPGG